MIIKTLAELREADEGSLLFSPAGLGGRMRPEDAAEFQQRVMAQYALSGQVPESTRKSFQRVQTIFSYGVLCYELYTVAGDFARLVIEQALRDRFLPFYGGSVAFSDAQGSPQVVTTTEFDALYAAIRSDDGRLKGWKLCPASGRPPFRFSGELTSLLRWARAENLLDGQRDRVADRPRVALRNFAAHPSYHLGTPVDAAEDVAELTRIINRLWEPTRGALTAREVVAVGWDERTVMWGLADRYDTGPLGEAAQFVLVRADPRSDLGSYDARYEAAPLPCDYLWGPGPWADARAWLEREQPAADSAATIDRLFMLRFHDQVLYLPQAIPVTAGLGESDRSGIWYLIRADWPADAFSHLRELLAGAGSHQGTGHCRCPAETLAQGSWQSVLRRAADAGADITARPVPDVRIPMSRMPRCNEILGGQWTIPATCR